ncbi:hypothetical protein MIMGU_mgv1a0050551mg, partial [Erythranthe guttata]
TTPFDFDAYETKKFEPSGWELALASTPSTNLSTVQERQLGGGLDSLILDSLYDDGAYRGASKQPAPNPFEVNDPFAAVPNPPLAAVPNPPTGQTNNPFGPFEPVYPQPEQLQQQSFVSPQNPFGDTGFETFPPPAPVSTPVFTPAPVSTPVFTPAPPPAFAQTHAMNPFGSTGIV